MAARRTAFSGLRRLSRDERQGRDVAALAEHGDDVGPDVRRGGGGLLDPRERSPRCRGWTRPGRGPRRGSRGRGWPRPRGGRAGRAARGPRRRGPGPRTRAGTRPASGSARGRPAPPRRPRRSGPTRPGAGRRAGRARAPRFLSRYEAATRDFESAGPAAGSPMLARAKRAAWRIPSSPLSAKGRIFFTASRLRAVPSALDERQAGAPGRLVQGRQERLRRLRAADGEERRRGRPGEGLVEEVLLEGPDGLLPPRDLDLREEERGDVRVPRPVRATPGGPGRRRPSPSPPPAA